MGVIDSTIFASTDLLSLLLLYAILYCVLATRLRLFLFQIRATSPNANL